MRRLLVLLFIILTACSTTPPSHQRMVELTQAIYRIDLGPSMCRPKSEMLAIAAQAVGVRHVMVACFARRGHGHAVVLYDGMVYDPWDGTVMSWDDFEAEGWISVKCSRRRGERR